MRRWASSFPDHKPQHWLLKLLGDRVDSFEHRLRKLAPLAVPLAVAGLFGRRCLAENRQPARSKAMFRGQRRRTGMLPRAFAH